MENNMQNGREQISKSWVNREVTYVPPQPKLLFLKLFPLPFNSTFFSEPPRAQQTLTQALTNFQSHSPSQLLKGPFLLEQSSWGQEQENLRSKEEKVLPKNRCRNGTQQPEMRC